jgi:hypothetical protein
MYYPVCYFGFQNTSLLCTYQYMATIGGRIHSQDMHPSLILVSDCTGHKANSAIDCCGPNEMDSGYTLQTMHRIGDIFAPDKK